jgi:plasmid maintenance system antidote protein VapI
MINVAKKILRVSRPYLGRVLRGEKSITAGMIERLRASSYLVTDLDVQNRPQRSFSLPTRGPQLGNKVT